MIGTEPRLTAGEMSRKILLDQTKYNARDVGYDMTDDIGKHLRQAIENHKNIIDEPEFCVVMLIAKDPLIKTVVRRKFYCWPYLPSPRPNQAVFLYNKGLDAITKRLWVMPSDMVMAELHSMRHVDKRYQTMKAWADAFYKGWRFIPGAKKRNQGSFVNVDPTHFWNVIRKENGITLESEHEYLKSHREELIQAGCKVPESNAAEPFDFSKIAIKDVVDTVQPGSSQDVLGGSVKA